MSLSSDAAAAGAVTCARYAGGMDHTLARHLFWLFTGALVALSAIYPVYVFY
ncbi:MAG TPA: hypothetical protein VFB01_09870 [Burkholderiales bacterium]|nr:hypothetical protein [Burkholderiales bacterium]